MPELADLRFCSGCAACFNACPVGSIEMRENSEGFLYPIVNKDSCTECKLCENVCPILNPFQRKEPFATFAAKNRNSSIRLESSSGGIFSLIAERIIHEGGVVFGACYNDSMQVEHNFTESLAELNRFMGSKYIQGNIDHCYRQAAHFLDSGRKVLFSGTPCQIAGLNHYLHRDYADLLTIEVVCHGVPSPKVWRHYLDTLNINLNHASVNFRDKQNGWQHYNFTISDSISGSVLFTEPASQNLFMKGFLRNIYLRPSCHHCVSKAFTSGADIVLGDFWGIRNYYPEFDDDKGVSLVIALSKKGADLFNVLSPDCIETDYKQALVGNPSIEYSSTCHPNRARFFALLNKNKIKADCLINDCLKPAALDKLKSIILKIIRK